MKLKSIKVTTVNTRAWLENKRSRGDYDESDDNSDNQGYTIIELSLVLTIIGIILSVAIPSYLRHTRRAEETQAKINLQHFHTAVATLHTTDDNFYLEEGGISDKMRTAAAEMAGITENIEDYNSVNIDGDLCSKYEEERTYKYPLGCSFITNESSEDIINEEEVKDKDNEKEEEIVEDKNEDEVGINGAIYVNGITNNSTLLELVGGNKSSIYGDILVDNANSANTSSVVLGDYNTSGNSKLLLASNSLADDLINIVDNFTGSEDWLLKRHETGVFSASQELFRKIPNYPHPIEIVNYDAELNFNNSSGRYYIEDNVEIEGNQNIYGGTVTKSFYVDGTKNGINIDGTTFNENVFLKSDSNYIEIRNASFKNVYIIGDGNIQIEDTQISGDIYAISGDDIQLENLTINGDSVLISENGVQITDILQMGDIYLSSSNSQQIQLDGNVNILGDLVAKGPGILQLSHDDECFIGGSIFAKNRFVDVHNDIKINYSIIANSLRLDKEFNIGSSL